MSGLISGLVRRRPVSKRERFLAFTAKSTPRSENGAIIGGVNLPVDSDSPSGSAPLLHRSFTGQVLGYFKISTHSSDFVVSTDT
jgi:hypothetical protein